MLNLILIMFNYMIIYIQGVNILKNNDIPKWMMNLEKEDFEFIKILLLILDH